MSIVVLPELRRTRKSFCQLGARSTIGCSSPKGSRSGKSLTYIKFTHYLHLPDFVFYCRTAYAAALS